MKAIRDYLAESARVLQALPVDDIERLVDLLDAAWRGGRRIFAAGNGGSASLAAHIACDLNKDCTRAGLPRLKVISLVDNVSTLTACANDERFEDIFVEQILNFYEPGDVVIGISGSGNSENLVRLLDWSRAQGAVVVGLLGYSGGRMKPLCDLALVADSYDMQHCQDAHLAIVHVVMQGLKQRMEQVDVG